MNDGRSKRDVAKVRWLVGLTEAEVARRHDRLLLKRNGVPFGSVTVDDLARALAQGQPGAVAGAGSAKQVAVREAYLARVEAIVALAEEDRDAGDFQAELDEMFFAWRVGAKGRTAKLMVQAALAVSRARRAVQAAGLEVEAASPTRRSTSSAWESCGEEGREVSLEDAELEVDRAAHAAWASSDADDVA